MIPDRSSPRAPLRAGARPRATAALLRLARLPGRSRSALVPAPSRRHPPPGRSTGTGPRAATCSAAPGTGAPDPPTAGVSARLSARDGRSPAGRPSTVPERRQRRRLLAAELPRQRLVVPQGLRAARVRAARAGSCASSRSTTARRSGSTASRSAATPARYLPFELEAGGSRRDAASTGSSCGSTAAAAPLDVPSLGRAPRRPLHRRLVELRRHPAGGLPAPGRSDSTSRTSLVRPQLRCRTCTATVDVDGDGREPGAQRAPTATVEGAVGGQRIDVRARRVVAARRRARASARASDARRAAALEPGAAEPLQGRAAGCATATARSSSATRVHIGIRNFEVDERGRLLLNFRPVSLRGASMHEDDPVRGAALARRDIRANIDLLRDLGATMTRSHYPLHPLTLELADRYGIAGLVRDARLPDAGHAVPERPRAAAQRCGMLREMSAATATTLRCSSGASATRTRPSPAPGFTRYVRAGEARWPGASTRRGWSGSRFPAIRRSASSALHGARRARRERLLRLVPGPAELDRRPRGARPLSRPAARRLPAPGAVRDRVRRRGEPPRPGDREGHVRVPARTSSPTTWASSRRSRSSTARWSGSCVISVSSRATTAATRSPTPPIQPQGPRGRRGATESPHSTRSSEALGSKRRRDVRDR